MAGTLYVIATPIGNLEDISARALRLLGAVSIVAAEDTRVTRRLLAHFGIRTPLVSYHTRSGPGRTGQLLRRLEAGEDVALVSDAGTPGVSDPGGLLVREAVDAGLAVVPVPGPSAVLAAVAASALDPSRFVFAGFLPRRRADRRRILGSLRGLPYTLVFFEAPPRVGAALDELHEVLGDRPAVVARELTKKFEEFGRGSLSDLAARYREEPPRGEVVIVVAGAKEEGEAPHLPDPGARLEARLREGGSVRDAAEVGRAAGLSRSEAYRRALEAEARLRGGD